MNGSVFPEIFNLWMKVFIDVVCFLNFPFEILRVYFQMLHTE